MTAVSICRVSIYVRLLFTNLLFYICCNFCCSLNQITLKNVVWSRVSSFLVSMRLFSWMNKGYIKLGQKTAASALWQEWFLWFKITWSHSWEMGLIRFFTDSKPTSYLQQFKYGQCFFLGGGNTSVSETVSYIKTLLDLDTWWINSHTIWECNQTINQIESVIFFF